jgi:hypothetical protein
MAFDGSEGRAIDLTTASEWTETYRESGSTLTLAHFFGKNIINSILAQTGCVGIRIYYGIDGNGKQALIMVGADSSENDILGTPSAPAIIANFAMPCPTYCSSSNPLNS